MFLRTLNLLAYAAASAASVTLYVMSVRPAQMEFDGVTDAYKLCQRYRMGSIVAMALAFVFFIATRYLPLASVFASPFRGPQWISLLFAFLLGVGGLALLVTGLQDLGSESFIPAKSTKLNTRGIYKTIRHPQVFSVLIWPAIALGLNSQYLLALTAPWVLFGVIMSMAEETDLVIRYGETYIKYRSKTGMFIPRGKLDLSFLKPILEYVRGLFNPDKD